MDDKKYREKKKNKFFSLCVVHMKWHSELIHLCVQTETTCFWFMELKILKKSNEEKKR